MPKNKRKLKDEQLSVPKMFAKKYIYYYYGFFLGFINIIRVA